MNVFSFVGVFFVALLALITVSVPCSTYTTIYENDVSEKSKRDIVNKHNAVRDLISAGKVKGQPKGTNLKNMTYDEKLAREAQKVSDTCVFEHVKIRDDRWHAVGQNLYVEYSSSSERGADWDSAIQSWFDEYPYYHYPDTRSNSLNGHYTQVVWADTDHVGCGYTMCRGGPYGYQKLYACNYGPAGNYIGQVPYET